MVRDKNKILAEPNDEDTTLTPDILMELMNGGLIQGSDNKFIKHELDKNQYGAIIFINEGIIQILRIEPNKLLGTDVNGNLAWV